MILYNVTLSLDPNIQVEWLEWMRNVHIPDVMGTGCFADCRLSRINGEEENGVTYSVLYFSRSKEQFEKYNTQYAPALQKEHAEKFQGKFAAFRTILDVIEEFNHVG